MYEALLRFLLEKVQNQQPGTSIAEDVKLLQSKLDQETFEPILANETFISYHNVFENFLEKLKQDNPLAEFWLSYVG